MREVRELDQAVIHAIIHFERYPTETCNLLDTALQYITSLVLKTCSIKKKKKCNPCDKHAKP